MSEQRTTFYATHRKNPGETLFLKVANYFEGGQGRKFGRLGHVAKKRRRSKTLTRAGFEGGQGGQLSLPWPPSLCCCSPVALIRVENKTAALQTHPTRARLPRSSRRSVAEGRHRRFLRTYRYGRAGMASPSDQNYRSGSARPDAGPAG